MEITISKLVALAMALACALGMLVVQGIQAAAAAGASLVVPLALIWFPEEIGSYTGYVGRGATIDAETPPFIVAGLGWLLLILLFGIPIVAIAQGHP
jgi:hypothetical protein